MDLLNKNLGCVEGWLQEIGLHPVAPAAVQRRISAR